MSHPWIVDPAEPSSVGVEAATRGMTPTECVLLAQQYLAAGAWQEAVEVSCAAADAAPEEVGLRLCEARARFALGQRDTALALLRDLRQRRPADPLCAFYHAQLLAQEAQHGAAGQALREVVDMAPDFPGALPALAQLLLPGPPYREVLRRLHAALAPRVYLEIGVEQGATLQLARQSAVAIGIDPVPRPIPHELPAGTRLFHMTSDAFFERHSRRDVLGDAHVDLAFIDGMHWFDYALRDLRNVESWCGPHSTVVMHDCLPVAAVAARRDRATRFWVGDTWKALEYLLLARPDLRIWVVPCHPSGLVVIKNVNPERIASPAAEELFAAEWTSKPYPYASGAWPSHYPMIENSERGMAELLRQLGADGARRRD